MCHCKLVWFSSSELSAVEHTQRVQTAKQQGQLQAVICSLAQQLAKGGCQREQLFPLASSMPEPGGGSWLFCQLWAGFTSSQIFISPSSPFLSSYGKNGLVTGPELCLEAMKSSATGGCNRTWQVPKEPSSKCLGSFFQCISFLFLLFQDILIFSSLLLILAVSFKNNF